MHPGPGGTPGPGPLDNWTITTSFGTATIKPGLRLDTNYVVIDSSQVTGTFRLLE